MAISTMPYYNDGEVRGAEARRAVGYLSDGTVVAVNAEQEITFLMPGVEYNDFHLYIHHSSDRVNWTLIDTITLLESYENQVRNYSMVVDGDDNIHIVWTSEVNASKGGIWYKKYTKGAGYTWTAEATEDAWVGAHDVNGTYLNGCDLDVSDDGWVLVAVHSTYDVPDPYNSYLNLLWRDGSGWSGNRHVLTEAGVVGQTYAPAMVMRDPRGAANGGHTFIAAGAAFYENPQVFYVRLASIDGDMTYLGQADLPSGSFDESDRGSVILPVNGDGAGDTNYWTWVLLYGAGGGTIRAQFHHLDQDGTFASRDSSELAPFVHSDSGPLPPNSVVGGSSPSGMSGFSVIKGEDGDWTTAGRMLALISPGGGARVYPFFDSSPEWTVLSGWEVNLGVWPLCGANRNIPNETVDALCISNFGTNESPDPPSSIEPIEGSTVITDLARMKAVLGKGGGWEGEASRGEWQVADDAGFTSNVKTVLEPWSDIRVRTSSQIAETAEEGDDLNQGTKYVRARTVTAFGAKSAWAGGHDFTISHPPSSTGHSPSGGVISPYDTGDVTFTWTFTDTSPVDEQTAFEIEVSYNSDGTSVHNSGKVTSGVSSHTTAIGSAHKNEMLRWRVRLYDSDDVAGSWSDYKLFELADRPTVAITDPTDNEEIDTARPTITWDYTTGSGRPQQAYRVTVRDNLNSVVDQTSWVSSDATSYELPGPLLENNGSYTVKVEVRDTGNLTDESTHSFTTLWVPPDHPDDSVDAATYDSDGYVLISWTNADEDPDFESYRVYRRDVATNENVLIYSTGSSSSTMTYHDWFAKSGREYVYEVMQTADRFGAVMESETDGGITVTPVSDNYWLIHPDSPDQESDNMILRQVNDDSFTEEYEQETFHLIGRGRKTDIGDRIGYTGSLSCQVWDVSDETARAHRLKLEALKATKREVYLRNPFGDLWQVTTGDIDITRTPGVGRREHHEVTLPYEEVS